ncbi:hypothetical protein EIP91_011423, partial [Steccherinum ochraceum]
MPSVPSTFSSYSDIAPVVVDHIAASISDVSSDGPTPDPDLDDTVLCLDVANDDLGAVFLTAPLDIPPVRSPLGLSLAELQLHPRSPYSSTPFSQRIRTAIRVPLPRHVCRPQPPVLPRPRRSCLLRPRLVATPSSPTRRRQGVLTPTPGYADVGAAGTADPRVEKTGEHCGVWASAATQLANEGPGSEPWREDVAGWTREGDRDAEAEGAICGGDTDTEAGSGEARRDGGDDK